MPLCVMTIYLEVTVRYPRSVDALLRAMRQVESGGNDRALGDKGRSAGPYQITEKYWKDAQMLPTYSYHNACSPTLSKQAVLSYWHRYCPGALERGNLQTLARIHNGGPSGNRKSSTRDYWIRVKSEMLRQSKRAKR